MTTDSIEAAKAERRAGYVKGLRALADALEAHPDDVPLPYEGDGTVIHFMFLSGSDDRAAMAAAARALPVTWRKEASDPVNGGAAYFDLTGELHGLHLKLTAFREAVCERVVTGTTEVEVEEVVKPAETRKIKKSVETVEWRCHPVMAGRPAPDEDEVSGEQLAEEDDRLAVIEAAEAGAAA